MPGYLDTMGLSRLSIAICDRCHMKRPWVKLVSDHNSPGLRVCSDRDCLDELDPYRLPARQVEDITMPWARPDDSVATDPAGWITEDGDAFIITEDSEGYLIL